VHELLVVPNANLAYVPIFGGGIHGRNPNPGHLLCIIDLEKRCSPASADGRILVAVDDAQPSSLFLIDPQTVASLTRCGSKAYLRRHRLRAALRTTA
jgi:hypothetical protein